MISLMNRKKAVRLITCLLIASVFGGCVPVYHYRHPPLHYEPIDSNTIRIEGHVEYVYIPRYRPRPMYHWDGMWYDEPYRYIPYQDVRGRIAPRKIPKRLYDKIERQAPVKPITPRRPINGRTKIRRRTKRQK